MVELPPDGCGSTGCRSWSLCTMNAHCGGINKRVYCGGTKRRVTRIVKTAVILPKLGRYKSWAEEAGLGDCWSRGAWQQRGASYRDMSSRKVSR